MILQQMLDDEGFSESDLDFSFEDEELNNSELENLGASFLSDPDIERALQLISDDNDSVFGDTTLINAPNRLHPVDPYSESDLPPATPSQSSEIDDFERFKRELEMDLPSPGPSPGADQLSESERHHMELNLSNAKHTQSRSESERKKLTGVEKKLQKKAEAGKPPRGSNIRRSKSAKLSSEAAQAPRERYRGATAALTPGARRRNLAPSTPRPPSEFDSKDFAARCKFKDTKEFKMMGMLRKAELMCQKRKRQLMNRQIAELEEELANFADNSIETMTVEEYNGLRDKLRLLPKEVRENSKGKALIAKIEQQAYLSRSRLGSSQIEDQKKAFRRAELEAIRIKRKKESAVLKQVIATGDVAPQNTLKRTREAVSRWLISNEDDTEAMVQQGTERSGSRARTISVDDASANTVDPDVMDQYTTFRDKVKEANEEIRARDGESAVLIAVQGIMLNTFIEFREWLYSNAMYTCGLSDLPGLLEYFDSAEVLIHFNEYKAHKKELRRQKARHRRIPGSGIGRSQSFRRHNKTDSVVESLRKSGSAHNLVEGLKKSGSNTSMNASCNVSNLSRAGSFHRLARRDSQSSLLIAGQDSEGMSVPISAVEGQYNSEEQSASGDEVWLQMVAAKLEKVKQEKRAKIARLGNIIDKVVRAIVSRCTCKNPFQLDRVGDGKYKLPQTSQIFFVRILRNHVMVRVGGGWDTLDHFIAKHDPCRMKFKQIIGAPNIRHAKSKISTSWATPSTSDQPRRNRSVSMVTSTPVAPAEQPWIREDVSPVAKQPRQQKTSFSRSSSARFVRKLSYSSESEDLNYVQVHRCLGSEGSTASSVPDSEFDNLEEKITPTFSPLISFNRKGKKVVERRENGPLTLFNQSPRKQPDPKTPRRKLSIPRSMIPVPTSRSKSCERKNNSVSNIPTLKHSKSGDVHRSNFVQTTPQRKYSTPIGPTVTVKQTIKQNERQLQECLAKTPRSLLSNPTSATARKVLKSKSSDNLQRHLVRTCDTTPLEGRDRSRSSDGSALNKVSVRPGTVKVKSKGLVKSKSSEITRHNAVSLGKPGETVMKPDLQNLNSSKSNGRSFVDWLKKRRNEN